MVEESTSCATFEGGDGVVQVTTCAEQKGTSVEVASREWDTQAGEFMAGMK